MDTKEGDVIKSFIEFLKLPPTILGALVIVTSAILFLPKSILDVMGLNELQSSYKMLISITFLISISLLFVYLLKYSYNKITSKYYKIRFERKFPLAMQSLNVEERQILALLYQIPGMTYPLPTTNGVIARLRSKLMIQFTSNQMIAYGDDLKVPFTITPIAARYIDNHQEFLSVLPKDEVIEIARNMDMY